MMQKFRICAGAVKVWSAKLLMGISWRGPDGRSRAPLRGPRVPPAYRGKAVSTQSRAPVRPLCSKTWRRRGRRFSGLSTSPRTSCSTRHPSSSAPSRNLKRCSAASSTGIRFGIDAITGTPNDEAPAITAGRPSAKIAFPPRSGPASSFTRQTSTAAPIPARSSGPGWFTRTTRRGARIVRYSSWAGTAHAARPDAVEPGTSPQRPQLGRHRQRQLGLRGRVRAGCDWTACSTFPRRASGARARSWNARCSRSWPRGCAPNTPGASAAPATSGTCSVRRRAA